MQYFVSEQVKNWFPHYVAYHEMNVIVKYKTGHISGIFYYTVFIIKEQLLLK